MDIFGTRTFYCSTALRQRMETKKVFSSRGHTRGRSDDGRNGFSLHLGIPRRWRDVLFNWFGIRLYVDVLLRKHDKPLSVESLFRRNCPAYASFWHADALSWRPLRQAAPPLVSADI